jgi:hypothetical protein
LLKFSGERLVQFRQAALATPEDQRCLENLNQACTIHSCRDWAAENALAELLEYVFDHSLPTRAWTWSKIAGLNGCWSLSRHSGYSRIKSARSAAESADLIIR